MREKLMRIVCDGLEDGCVGHCNYPHCYRVNNVADILIANGVTIQQWIPVSERLPERNGEYLVCTIHDFYKTKKVAKASFRRNRGGFYGNGGHWSNVTHWMPLPEPPKGAA